MTEKRRTVLVVIIVFFSVALGVLLFSFHTDDTPKARNKKPDLPEFYVLDSLKVGHVFYPCEKQRVIGQTLTTTIYLVAVSAFHCLCEDQYVVKVDNSGRIFEFYEK